MTTWLSTTQVADLLGITRPTLNGLEHTGRIGPVPLRLGQRIIHYDAAEVAAWIASKRPDGTLPGRDEWTALRAKVV